MIFSPRWFYHRAAEHIKRRFLARNPNFKGVAFCPPGHFYSPLLDLERLRPGDAALPDDGEEYWEFTDLRPSEQRAYFQSLLAATPQLELPSDKRDGYRYFSDNRMFVYADAFTLSSMMVVEKPQRIIEVGSGFSSAVMLDTVHEADLSTELTFVEPYPDRLNSLLRPEDRRRSTTLVRRVQEVPLSLFEELEERDMLFIDSSHVAKIGSDLVFLVLRVLPRLKPGVLIHFHDIVYPHSLPVEWVREGRAWNESLFLRAFLMGNPDFQVRAFNSFAAKAFPDLFEKQSPRFLSTNGGSIWIEKVS